MGVSPGPQWCGCGITRLWAVLSTRLYMQVEGLWVGHGLGKLIHFGTPPVTTVIVLDLDWDV